MSAAETPAPPKPFASWRTPASRADWLVLGITAGHWVYQRWRERRALNRDTVLRFSPEDAPYYWLLRWLETMPRQKGITVFRVMAPQEGEPETVGSTQPGSRKKRVPVMVPTEGVRFDFRGVKCSIEKTGDAAAKGETGFYRRPDLVLSIGSRDPEIALAVLEAIAEAGVGRKEAPKVFVYQWGWVPVRACPTGRAAILPDDEYKKLSDDLHAFYDSENWYRGIGLAHRRGYLFHGITGSGKSTTAIALAGDFNCNLCVLALSQHNDTSILEALRSRPANSILLLEDIDCAWDEDRKTKDDKPLTFSGLLNVLDGAATPEGQVTFMTTNKHDKLDPALIRPGRVDIELKFGSATSEQIAELAKRFSPSAVEDIDVETWSQEQISMAQVQERLIRRYRHPVKIRDAVENEC